MTLGTISNVLDVLEQEKHDTLELVKQIQITIDTIKRLRPAPTEQRQTKQKQTGKKLAASPAADRKKSTSEYYGVSKLPPGKRKPGMDRYRAQVRVDGRYRWLGIFYGPAGEVEAAAKVQDAIGNPAEAQRLRRKAADLAEQLEAKPDRPKPKRRKRKEPGDLPSPAAHKYECNKCGRDYVGKPAECEQCHGKSFIRINADGSGQWDDYSIRGASGE